MRAPNRQPRGFVLLAVLWVLTILALIAGAFALWVEAALSRADRSNKALQGDIDGLSSKSTVLYLLSTRPVTPAGLVVAFQTIEQKEFDEDPLANTTFESMTDDTVTYKVFNTEMRLDGSPYHGVGSSYVGIQDHAGLVDLNLAPPHVLSGLLSATGVPAELHPTLIDRLQDFMDADDFHRLQGAERYHYEQAGKRPPENRRLVTPAEIQQVLGWRENVNLSPLGEFMGSVTVGKIGNININAATVPALQTLPGFTREMAESVVRYRRKKTISTLPDLAVAAGVPVEVLLSAELPIQLQPSGKFRISLWYDAAPVVTQYNLELTPFNHEGRPWQLQWGTLGPLNTHDDSQPVQYTQTTLFAQPDRPAAQQRAKRGATQSAQ